MRILTELEEQARARLPDAVYDYYAGGAGEEGSLHEAVEAWRRWWLVPRQLATTRPPDCATSLLGARLRMPVVIAPMAAQSVLHPDGERAMARAAASAGAAFCLSSRSTTEPEDIAEAAPDAVRFFQLYVDADRSRTARLLERLRPAGFSHVVFTADLPVAGRRERERAHPPLRLPGGADKPPTGGWARVGWPDVEWAAQASGLPIVVKGILSAHDAEQALTHGASAVVVSAHGARQLDGVVPTAVALPDVVAAVDRRVAVLVDGGVRSGTDVVRALALGADGVMVGRPCAWGLAAGGQAGVERVLAALREDLERTLALIGAARLSEVGPHHVRARGG